jgi:hypothetical protein
VLFSSGPNLQLVHALARKFDHFLGENYFVSPESVME